MTNNTLALHPSHIDQEVMKGALVKPDRLEALRTCFEWLITPNLEDVQMVEYLAEMWGLIASMDSDVRHLTKAYQGAMGMALEFLSQRDAVLDENAINVKDAEKNGQQRLIGDLAQALNMGIAQTERIIDMLTGDDDVICISHFARNGLYEALRKVSSEIEESLDCDDEAGEGDPDDD